MIYFMEKDEPINSVERLAEVLWKATLTPPSPEDIALGVQSLREISCERGLYWPGHQHTSECSRAGRKLCVPLADSKELRIAATIQAILRHSDVSLTQRCYIKTS